jgi:hypothetical protein
LPGSKPAIKTEDVAVIIEPEPLKKSLTRRLSITTDRAVTKGRLLVPVPKEQYSIVTTKKLTPKRREEILMRIEATLKFITIHEKSKELSFAANMENWIHFLCYPFFLKYVRSHNAYKGELFYASLFTPFVFLLHSTGQVVGGFLGGCDLGCFCIPATSSCENYPRVRAVVVILTSISCVIAFFYSNIVPVSAYNVYMCPAYISNNATNGTEGLGEEYVKDMEALCQAGKGISDVGFCFVVFIFGFLHGYWILAMPKDDPKYDWEDEASEQWESFTAILTKLGMALGSGTSIIASVFARE